MFYDDDEYNEDAGNVDDLFFKKPATKSKKRVSDFQEKDYSDLLSHVTMAGSEPMRTNESSSDTIVPSAIYRAASTLLDAYNNGQQLSRWTLGDLQKIVSSRDEYTMIDPPIVLTSKVATERCIIYLKEVVSVSTFCLAAALKCTFCVKITSTLVSAPKPYYGGGDVDLKPYRGSRTAHIQPLGCQQSVRDALVAEGYNVEDILNQVDVYMVRLGRVSSEEAISQEWLDFHVEKIGKILAGELPQIVAAPPPRDY